MLWILTSACFGLSDFPAKLRVEFKGLGCQNLGFRKLGFRDSKTHVRGS